MTSFCQSNLSNKHGSGYEGYPDEFSNINSDRMDFYYTNIQGVRMNYAKISNAKFNNTTDMSNGSFIGANFFGSSGLDNDEQVKLT